jgi:type I restriction enzyme S subunit
MNAQQLRKTNTMNAIASLEKLLEERSELDRMLTSRLQKSILQEAMQGRLVPQDPKEEPASELLKRIRKEKEQLVKEGKLKKKDLESKPIEEDEIPFEIPESWEWVKIEDITIPIGNKNNQIQSKEVLKEGKVAVVSQGKELIDGYSNEIDKTIKESPLIMFGDHTRNVKYIDFPFVIGADGTKFFKPILCYARFMYYLVLHIASKLRDRGYARHYSLLKEEPLPLPPLSEQKRIVAKVEELFGVIKGG